MKIPITKEPKIPPRINNIPNPAAWSKSYSYIKLICPTRALIVRMIPIIRPPTPLKRRKLVSFKAVLTLFQIPLVAVLGLDGFKYDPFLASLNIMVITVNKMTPIMD